MGKSKTKKVMTITRERALKLFEYFKYKTASKWSSKRMEGKLANLPEMADDTEIKNDKVKAILEEIAAASGICVLSSKGKPKKEAQEKETKPVEEKEATKEKKTEKKKGSKRFGKKDSEKKQTKSVTKKVGKSNKEKVYELFLKVKSEKALDHCEKWWEAINKEVKLPTIRSWVGQWKKGKALPACARKK